MSNINLQLNILERMNNVPDSTVDTFAKHRENTYKHIFLLKGDQPYTKSNKDTEPNKGKIPNVDEGDIVKNLEALKDLHEALIKGELSGYKFENTTPDQRAQQALYIEWLYSRTAGDLFETAAKDKQKIKNTHVANLNAMRDFRKNAGGNAHADNGKYFFRNGKLDPISLTKGIKGWFANRWNGVKNWWTKIKDLTKGIEYKFGFASARGMRNILSLCTIGVGKWISGAIRAASTKDDVAFMRGQEAIQGLNFADIKAKIQAHKKKQEEEEKINQEKQAKEQHQREAEQKQRQFEALDPIKKRQYLNQIIIDLDTRIDKEKEKAVNEEEILTKTLNEYENLKELAPDDPKIAKEELDRNQQDFIYKRKRPHLSQESNQILTEFKAAQNDHRQKGTPKPSLDKYFPPTHLQPETPESKPEKEQAHK